MPKNPLTELITWLYVPLSGLQNGAPLPAASLVGVSVALLYRAIDVSTHR